MTASQRPGVDAGVRTLSESVYAGIGAGILGAVLGLVSAFVAPGLPLAGPGSFGVLAAVTAGCVAAVAATVAYWRSRSDPTQAWRLRLSRWRFIVQTVSVVLVHAVLAAIVCFSLYLILGAGFIGLSMVPFWSAVLLAVTLGLAGYLTYASASQVTAHRLSTLLVAFIFVGALAAMVTTTDPEWWMVHFSHLGTFDSISSILFNGTLIIGGLLVTTFAVYVQNDMRSLVDAGILTSRRSPAIVATTFAIMGVLLAGVGLVPVDVNLLVHNLSATGMAILFLGLLISAPWVLHGMPRTFHLTSWLFLGAMVASVILFAVGYFGLTAFEIIVFALIFGWIAVFIRFLGAAGEHREAIPPAPSGH